MARLQKDGHVRSDVDARSAGELWFNGLNMMFTIVVKLHDMSLADLKSKIKNQSEPFVLALGTK